MPSNKDVRQSQKWIANAAFAVSRCAWDQIWTNSEELEFSKASRRLHAEYNRLRGSRNPHATTAIGNRKAAEFENPFQRGHCAVWIEWILEIYTTLNSNYKTNGKKLLEHTGSNNALLAADNKGQDGLCNMRRNIPKGVPKRNVDNLLRTISSISIKQIWENVQHPPKDNNYLSKLAVMSPQKCTETRQLMTNSNVAAIFLPHSPRNRMELAGCKPVKKLMYYQMSNNCHDVGQHRKKHGSKSYIPTKCEKPAVASPNNHPVRDGPQLPSTKKTNLWPFQSNLKIPFIPESISAEKRKIVISRATQRLSCHLGPNPQ